MPYWKIDHIHRFITPSPKLLSESFIAISGGYFYVCNFLKFSWVIVSAFRLQFNAKWLIYLPFASPSLSILSPVAPVQNFDAIISCILQLHIPCVSFQSSQSLILPTTRSHTLWVTLHSDMATVGPYLTTHYSYPCLLHSIPNPSFSLGMQLHHFPNLKTLPKTPHPNTMSWSRMKLHLLLSLYP